MIPQVPIFLEDESVSLSSLIKRLSAFGMGGWWLGGTHMQPNQNFLAEVQVGTVGEGPAGGGVF